MKGIVSLYIPLINPRSPTFRMKFGAWSTKQGGLDGISNASTRLVVTNRASHGRGARAVVDRRVEEHETMSAFTVPS